MATKTPKNIEEIRSIERVMFWLERFAMFVLVIFARKPSYFQSAFALFVCTNTTYISLFVDRLRIRPYPHDADDMFYLERFAMFCLAFYYTSSESASHYTWFIAAAFFIMTNLGYVVFLLEPTQMKNLQMNSTHASTTRGPNPKETEEDEELKKGKAETDDEAPKEKLEDNQLLKEGKWDEELLKVDEDHYGHWVPLKIENVEHEVNHEKERTEIEDNLVEGEKGTCNEEEPKKAEDIYDAELLETDEISNESEESWEDVEKTDEEKDAIDQEGDQVQELKAKIDEISNASEESWEEIEKKDEEKAAIDQEDDQVQELKAKADEISNASEESWEDIEKKDEEKDAIDQDDDQVQELKAKIDEISNASEKSWEGVEKKDEEKAAIDQDDEVQQLKAKCDALESEADQEKKELIENITATHTDKIIEALNQLQEAVEQLQKEAEQFKEKNHVLEEEKKDLCEMNHKLEEEKNDLCAKLEAVSESVEYYRGIKNDFEEERRKWNEECEFYTLTLETCRDTIQTKAMQITQRIRASEKRR